MEKSVMLSCGCRANSTNHLGEPSCVIHAGNEPLVVMPDPDLTYRTARCGCGRTERSTLDLAFFMYRGEGSPHALENCGVCHYNKVAHGKDRDECAGFEAAGPHEFDEFYCGCRGWD